MNPLKLPLFNGCTHTLGEPVKTITVIIILQKIGSENMINVLKLQTIHLVVEVYFLLSNCKKDDGGDVMSMMMMMVMIM